jgi:hypothetical protein
MALPATLASAHTRCWLLSTIKIFIAILAYCVLAPPVAAHAQSAPLLLGADATRTLAPGETHDYVVRAKAGDLISGQLQLNGAICIVAIRDAAAKLIRTFGTEHEPLTEAQGIGFVAPEQGDFRIQIAAAGGSSGSYTLRMTADPVSVRMRGVTAIGRETYPSGRIAQLLSEIKSGDAGAVTRFWGDVNGKVPIVEPTTPNSDDVLVTFLWRESYELHDVLVLWPPADARADDYYMTHLYSAQ